MTSSMMCQLAKRFNMPNANITKMLSNGKIC